MSRSKSRKKRPTAKQRIVPARFVPLRRTAPALEAAPTQPDSPNFRPVSEAELRLRAYQKWEAAGRPPSDGVNFWLEAEHELRGQ